MIRLIKYPILPAGLYREGMSVSGAMDFPGMMNLSMLTSIALGCPDHERPVSQESIYWVSVGENCPRPGSENDDDQRGAKAPGFNKIKEG